MRSGFVYGAAFDGYRVTVKFGGAEPLMDFAAATALARAITTAPGSTGAELVEYPPLPKPAFGPAFNGGVSAPLGVKSW